MQDNSEVKGTNSESQGLTESDFEKLFEAAYNGQDVSKVTSESTETPPPELSSEEQSKETPPATPAESDTEKPSDGTKGNDQVDPNANSNPYAWVESLSDADMKAKVSRILAERQDLEHRWKSDNGRLRSAAQTVNQLRLELEKATKHSGRSRME